MRNPFVNSYNFGISKDQKSSIKQKKQQFRSQIRNNKFKQLKTKTRKLLQFNNQENYQQLKKINLTQDLKVILSIENLFKEQNQKQQAFRVQFIDVVLKKAIQDIFIYSVSTQMDHLYSLILNSHLKKLLSLLKYFHLKKKQIKYFSFFNKILWILANYTSYDPTQMPIEFTLYLYNFLSEYRHSNQIIQLCLNSFINLLEVQTIKIHLIQQHQQNQQKDSTIDRILKIMTMIMNQFQNIEIQQEYSTAFTSLQQFLQKILLFYEKLFSLINPQVIKKQYKECFFMMIIKIIEKYQNQLYIMSNIAKILTQFYLKSLQSLPSVIIQTEQVIECLSSFLIKKVKLIKKSQKQNKFLQSIVIQVIFCLHYIYTPFYSNQDNDQSQKQIAIQILDSNFSQSLSTALYYGLICGRQQISNWCLKLLINVCDQYQFTDLIMNDFRLLNQIFNHSFNSSFLLKKSGTICLCRLTQSLFTNQKIKAQIELDEQYSILTDNNLIQILIQNLDQFVDRDLNEQILETIYILCEFCNVNSQNLFWNKFQEQGGRFKLQRIINSQRNYELKQKVELILKFSEMDIEI